MGRFIEPSRRCLPVGDWPALDQPVWQAALAHDRADSTLASAVTYRNWVMLATVTLVPLRRDNFATLSIGRHFRRVGQEWSIEIPAAEAKGKEPIMMPIPSILHAALQHYLKEVRPKLLNGRDDDRVWISQRHRPMTGHSMY